MRKLVLRAVALAVVLSPALVFTQGGKTKPTTATYITKEEVDLVNSQGQGIDRKEVLQIAVFGTFRAGSGMLRPA